MSFSLNKNSVLSIGTAVGLTILLSACASTPKNSLAIQKENNQFEVTGLGKTQIISKNNAVSAANKACGRSATPIIVEDKTQYQGALKGVVNEETGQIIQAAASILGSVTGVKTGIAQDEDYQTTLTFRCQAQ
jgi:predicted lipoprotein with Yx(FWY)xxD motif